MGEMRAQPVIGLFSAATGKAFPLAVDHSAADYYIGTYAVKGALLSRERAQYRPTAKKARAAFTAGE